MFRKKRSEAERPNWKYCSRACADLHRNPGRPAPRIKRQCFLCCVAFSCLPRSTRRFCTAQCALRFRNHYDNPAQSVLVRAKISQAAKQRGTEHMRTRAARAKQARSISGALHWNWQGGITPANKRRRNLAEYRQWRISVFERDNYTCKQCGKRGVDLEADHIKPWSLYPDLRLTLSNGRTLCKPCHRATPTYMGRVYQLKKQLELPPTSTASPPYGHRRRH